MLGQVTGLPVLFVRKAAKEYGTSKLAEGQEFAGRRVTVVEDVVTSGGQVVTSCGDLRDRGAIVDHALCVIDREAGGPEALAAMNITLHPLVITSYSIHYTKLYEDLAHPASRLRRLALSRGLG